jgi:hypothetical protein
MHTPHSLAAARPLTKLSALMLATLVLLAAAFAGPFMSNASASSASCQGQAPKVCTVIEPVVTEFLTPYPQVQLLAGQEITFDAGGCTQTGGHGKTWKRFLDPISDSPSLYTGMVSVPGTVGPTAIKNIRNAFFTVGRNTPLYVGIKDDNYSDNGYWGRPGDDGTQNQCKGLGNAWVRLTIY